MFLGLTASTIVLAGFTFSGLPARAQAEAPEGPPEQSVPVINEEDVVSPDMDSAADCCEPWAEKMGLSDEQMEKLVSLKSEYAEKIAPQKAELMADMKKMMLLMTASSLDKSAVMSLHEKIANIKADMCTARVNHMLSVAEVMTPKQRADIRHHMLVHMVSPHHMMGKGPKGPWHHGD
jgi:Spy/CpxP family protein refolding chaperone